MIEPKRKRPVCWMPGFIIPDRVPPFQPKSQDSTAALVERESYALIKRAQASSFWALQKQGK